MSEDREHDWTRELTRASRELGRVVDRERRSMSDFLRGRWSTVPPARDGVYCARVSHDAAPHVRYFDPSGASPFRAGATTWEWFYLSGDADGAPTRWDDERVAREAIANGWRQPPALPDGRTRRQS